MVNIDKVIKYVKKAMKMYNKHKQSQGAGGGVGGAPAGGGGARETNIMDGLAAVASMAGVPGANKWKLSNIGSIGSKEDATLRKEAANSEAEFDGAGEQVGIEIWRVEKFKPARQSIRASNLSLYSGDAYIILVTTKKPDSSELEWTLHFWLGSESTQDEQGSAAYFCVNIDDKLNGKPVQHRETQGAESSLFMSHFDSVTYLDGGCDSGFKTVEPTSYKPRLLHVKGLLSKVRVSQVPLSSASITQGDVYILDNGLKLFQFNGKTANVAEKRRAMEIVEQDIQAERNGLPELTILDGDEAMECEDFWGLLAGGKPASIPAGDDRPDEVAVSFDEIDFSAPKKLFKISDESGEMTLSLEKESTSLTKSEVNDSDVWCVSCSKQLFVFVGSNTSKDERFYITQHVDKVLEAAELQTEAPVTFVNGHSNCSLWEKLFA